MHFLSNVVCSGSWGRPFLVIDDFWEPSGGAWTGTCASINKNYPFSFNCPLHFSILDGGKRAGLDRMTGWGGRMEWDEITMGLPKTMG